MDESEIVYPRRCRWLKLLGVPFVLVSLACMSVLAWWYYTAHRELTSLVNEYRLRGEPVFPEEFNGPAIAEAENAAPLVEALANPTLRTAALRDAALAPPDGLPLTKKEAEAWKRLCEDNVAALAAVGRVRSRRYLDWGRRYGSPATSADFASVAGQSVKDAAQFLHAVVLYEIHTHQFAAAAAHIRDLLAIASRLEQEPVIVAHLVSLGAVALACDAARQLSYESIGDGGSRGEIAELIGDLLDEKAQREGLVRAFNGERMVELDVIRTMARNTPVFSPVLELDACRAFRGVTAMRDAGASVDWPAAHGGLPLIVPDEFMESAERAAKVMSRTMTPVLWKVVQYQFRAMTERRAAAILLGIRLYREGHRGALPAGLSDLCPQYLSQVPRDPMAAARKPFHYAQKAGLVWSVGLDGGDDHGDAGEVLADGEHPGIWDGPDTVFPLSRPARINRTGSP